MDALISAAIGLLGTLVGAAIAWLAGRRSDRLNTAFAMHREFHSPEMTHSRNLAGATVWKHPSMTYDEMRRMLSPDETQHVWNMMYFYQPGLQRRSRAWPDSRSDLHDEYRPRPEWADFYQYEIKAANEGLSFLYWRQARLQR
jgi:hypothetical protein